MSTTQAEFDADDRVNEIMTRCGFTLVGTGGNLDAWRKDIDLEGCYVLVSTEEGEAYGDPDALQWRWCRYVEHRPDIGCGGLTLEAAATWAYAYVLSCPYKGY